MVGLCRKSLKSNDIEPKKGSQRTLVFVRQGRKKSLRRRHRIAVLWCSSRKGRSGLAEPVNFDFPGTLNILGISWHHNKLKTVV